MEDDQPGAAGQGGMRPSVGLGWGGGVGAGASQRRSSSFAGASRRRASCGARGVRGGGWRSVSSAGGAGPEEGRRGSVRRARGVDGR